MLGIRERARDLATARKSLMHRDCKQNRFTRAESKHKALHISRAV